MRAVPERTIHRLMRHHGRDGRFRNPWPESEPPDWRAVGRVMVEYFSRRQPPPRRGSFPTSNPCITRPRASKDQVAATWIGHSTVLLQIAGMNLLTDPIFSGRAFPVQWMGPRRVMDPAIQIDDLPPIDIVLVSHNHYDHLDRSSAEQLARANPDATWVVPLKLGRTLHGWGVRNVIELDWWEQARISELKVIAAPARHMSARGLLDRASTLWCGFALESEGFRAFFAGDTGYHPEFVEVGLRCGPFDLVMLPVGAYEPRWMMERVHANPEEAVAIYQDLLRTHPDSKHATMLPIHWGTFPLTLEGMDEPPRRLSARWIECRLDPTLLWIAHHGETRRFQVQA